MDTDSDQMGQGWPDVADEREVPAQDEDLAALEAQRFDPDAIRGLYSEASYSDTASIHNEVTAILADPHNDHEMIELGEPVAVPRDESETDYLETGYGSFVDRADHAGELGVQTSGHPSGHTAQAEEIPPHVVASADEVNSVTVGPVDAQANPSPLLTAPLAGHRDNDAQRRLAHPLISAICEDEATEIHLNGPDYVQEKVDGICYAARDKDRDEPLALAATVEEYHAILNDILMPFVDTKQRIGDDGVEYIEGRLTLPHPDGNEPVIARVHVVCPPVTQWAYVTIAKRPRQMIDLQQMVDNGSMLPGMRSFLIAAMRGRMNMVIAGMMGDGKTTLMQALLENIDDNDRIALIEETPELSITHADVIPMSAPSAAHEDRDWVARCVRNTKSMRLNRIVLGESRGPEALEFLSAAAAVADGSLVSLHAFNPRRALDRLITDASRSPHAPEEKALRREVAATINLVIQVARVSQRHMVTGIEAISNSVNDTTGAITSQELFTYHESAGNYRVFSPPQELVDLLSARGVPVDLDWFSTQP